MGKIKIIVTAGPSVDDKEVLRRMTVRGAEVLRINANHGNKDQWERFLRMWRDIDDTNPVALDLRGPSIRITHTSKEVWRVGEKVRIGEDIRTSTDIEPYLEEGNIILIDDGKVVLEVISSRSDTEAVVITGGRIERGKSVNLPGVEIRFELPTQKDKEDILWAIEHGVDLLFLSFVNSSADVKSFRDFVEDKEGDMWLVSKIENSIGVENADNIIRASDGIMVARGDLGVEVPYEKLPHIQKYLIKKARQRGVPAIVATQLLPSMVENPYPTRAEISDIANAVIDGASSLMLSNETAVGKYPVEAVEVLRRIADAAEENISPCKDPIMEGIEDHVSLAAHTLATSLGTKVLLLPVYDGSIVKKIARFNPPYTISAFSHDKRISRRVKWIYGVEVFTLSSYEKVLKEYKSKGVLKEGEYTVYVSKEGEKYEINLIGI